MACDQPEEDLLRAVPLPVARPAGKWQHQRE